MRLLVCLITITTGVVVRGQRAGPNAVATINGQTVLDCTINIDHLPFSNWRHSSNGTNFKTISIGCGLVTGNNAAYYRTEVVGGNICRLFIANVTMQQAGVYTCYDGASTVYRSLITVIDSVAIVVVYNQSEVVDGDQLNISCSINYNAQTSPAPSLRPLPYWETSSGQSLPGSVYYPSTNVVTLVATVTVQKPTVPIYQCNTVFEITGNTSGYNSTAPADNIAVGSTPEIDVQYPVETIDISSTVPTQDKCVSKLEILTCTANANPPAQYVWLDLKNNITTPGANKSISSGGDYQCTASNSIRSQTYNEKKNATETSCYSPYNLTINGTDCANNFCTCNGNESYSEPITITCMANGFPIPSVKWLNADSSEFSGSDILVAYNGNYTCIATNTYWGNPYSEELTVVVSGCPGSSSIVLLTSLMCLILGALFVIYYGKTGKRSTYNRHFPFLTKMLPFMNTNVYGQDANTYGNEGEQHPIDSDEHNTQTFSTLHSTDKTVGRY